MKTSPDGAVDTADEYFSEEAATFGDRLAAAREAAGLSLAALASKIGVMPETVKAWENDRTEPRSNRLQMLAGVLNVSVTWLMTGIGDGVTPASAAKPATDEVLEELRILRADAIRMTERIGRLEIQLREVLG